MCVPWRLEGLHKADPLGARYVQIG